MYDMVAIKSPKLQCMGQVTDVYVSELGYNFSIWFSSKYLTRILGLLNNYEYRTAEDVTH